MYLRVAGCCVAYFEQIPAQDAAVGAPSVNLANAPATYARTWAQNHVAATSAIFLSHANATTGSWPGCAPPASSTPESWGARAEAALRLHHGMHDWSTTICRLLMQRPEIQERRRAASAIHSAAAPRQQIS